MEKYEELDRIKDELANARSEKDVIERKINELEELLCKIKIDPTSYENKYFRTKDLTNDATILMYVNKASAFNDTVYLYGVIIYVYKDNMGYFIQDSYTYVDSGIKLEEITKEEFDNLRMVAKYQISDKENEMIYDD